LENARRKAEAISTAGESDELVLGVDTVVALEDRMYGKPSDAADARATLDALSGRTHAVIGGLCLIGPDGTRIAVATTEVEFRPLEGELLDWYLSTGEWRDRAGAYAIQGKGAALVKRIEGDYLNVVGLPLAVLLELEAGLIGS
jgi:septum formation protein